MAFDFDTFGATPDTSTKKVEGFDFNTFGSTPKTSTTPSMSADQKSAQEYNALFPSKVGDSPVKAGLKALGNVPSSAFNLAKGLGSAIVNPIETLKGIGTTAVGGVQKLIPGQQAQEEQFSQFASFLKERYGSLENLQRTATNDPFGFGTDVLGLVAGGAGIAGKTAQLNKGLSAVAQTVTKPVAKGAGAVGTGIAKTTRFGASQATGLNPETISNIIENPKAFTPEALKETTRVNLGSSVKEAIDARLENLSEIGSGYETIKQLPVVVEVPKGTVESVLKKYGVEVVDGKVKTTAEAKPLTSADKTALEDFISVYGNEPQLSANAFLNTRSALSQLSKYDAAKTGNLNVIARELRGIYDDLGKNQVPGLAELDAQYAPEVKALSQIKKDYLTATGEFKDGAINKIANLTGAGKEQVLNRLEKIVPGVTQRIKIVKAAEDIERASGLKVGTYARGALGVVGLTTANIPAILTAIIASPEVAVRLLKAYGYTKKTAEPIIKALYGMANDVNNFRLPGQVQEYISEYLKNPKMGMSIEDITRSQPELIPKAEKIQKIQSQASSPKSTTKPSPQSSLLTEAKKYKSAEEFVRAQGETLYHGTSKNTPRIDSKDFMVSNKERGTPGFSVTFDKKRATDYGEKVYEVKINPDANIISLDEALRRGEITLNKYNPRYSEENAIKWAYENGYDAVDISQAKSDWFKKEKEIRVFNKNAVITKERLIDTWNKSK